MNRKKVILSIFLMLFLAVITLVLPSICLLYTSPSPRD